VVEDMKMNIPAGYQRIDIKKKRMNLWLLILIVSLCVFGLIFLMMKCSLSSTSLDIYPYISFDGEQFTIENTNDFDWYDVRFTLNSSYNFHAETIEANTTYTVGVMQFTKSDGTRFNPLISKPLNMGVNCENKDGKSASWFGSWD
jgi:hypothetical protein